MTQTLQTQTLHLNGLDKNLQLIDPKQVLLRGYSVVRDADGKLVQNAAQLATGQALHIRFAHGTAHTQVLEIGE